MGGTYHSDFIARFYLHIFLKPVMMATETSWILLLRLPLSIVLCQEWDLRMTLWFPANVLATCVDISASPFHTPLTR